MQPGFFLPEIQAIAFPQTRLIPPTELSPSAFNVPLRPVVLPSISLPLMVFLILPTTASALIGPRRFVALYC